MGRRGAKRHGAGFSPLKPWGKLAIDGEKTCKHCLFLCLSSEPDISNELLKSPHQKREAHFDGLITMNFHGALALQLLFGPKNPRIWLNLWADHWGIYHKFRYILVANDITVWGYPLLSLVMSS